MPFPSIFTRIMAVKCAGLPELGLLGEESRLPGLDQNGYEHRLIAAFIQNNYAVSIINKSTAVFYGLYTFIKIWIIV